MNGKAIYEVVTAVTKNWTKQRKAEERDARKREQREQKLARSQRVSAKEVAWGVMEDAYLAASSGNTLPAHVRQVFYAARPLVQAETGEPLVDKYFTQTLLPDYISEFPDETANWDVVLDARGHFTEPHTGQIVPLGTLDVRDYVGKIERATLRDLKILIDLEFPTCGPRHRFNAILFIEKEGFLPLFQKVRLAERYDIAIMSTKGMSVTASRFLVDKLCSDYKIPLLVLHDFDKSGFSIVGTLRRDTRRYSFVNKIEVVDLGLRLKDVEECDLDAEDVNYRTWQSEDNLRLNGATAKEAAFILGDGDSGRRVELNAFTSRNFVDWIERKLQQHGIKKVVPDSDTIVTAYRRALQAKRIASKVHDLVEQSRLEVSTAPLPPNLEVEVRKRLHANPDWSWDKAVADIVR